MRPTGRGCGPRDAGERKDAAHGHLTFPAREWEIRLAKAFAATAFALVPMAVCVERTPDDIDEQRHGEDRPSPRQQAERKSDDAAGTDRKKVGHCDHVLPAANLFQGMRVQRFANPHQPDTPGKHQSAAHEGRKRDEPGREYVAQD